ncbi:MAG: phosphatase domain-containing protein [Bdellovibrionota bacterium]
MSDQTDARYQLDELISTEYLIAEPEAKIQVICDIDKTYIETRFETPIAMLKIAFENAEQKVTVTGAPVALLAARWGNFYGGDTRLEPNAIHFLSASPPQLRRVIRSKLAIDGLDWTSDTFKNQAYNIKTRKLKFLKQHVAYKTATILKQMSLAPKDARFILIGDNAELDAFIYLGVQLFVEKKLSLSGYREYLSLGGVHDEVLPTLEPYLQLQKEDISVAGIMIRKAPRYELVEAPPLTEFVLPFDHYFEVILHFHAWGLISDDMIWPISRQLHNEYGYTREDVVSALARTAQCFDLLNRDNEHLRSAIERLKADVPLSGLKDMLNFNPGMPMPALNLSEAEILHASKRWVEAIASRKH